MNFIKVKPEFSLYSYTTTKNDLKILKYKKHTAAYRIFVDCII